ncbi:MAG: acetylornithine aminotransferase [Verrucomicrobia bacterium TMED56]|jgi:acetylornithine/N-succinyldiaminopimelate aminotransferase|nr:MAG: acetylornithine aminotransferase [Verrucomicrobia bacterium TMED56]
MISSEHSEFLVGNYAPPAIEIIRGKGTKVWDKQDKEYLDFTSGIAVNNLGHSHPYWIDSVTAQANQLVHCSNLFSIPEQVRLAKRLVEKIGKGKLLFCNSGAEANEGMIKLVRLNENQRNKNPRHNILVAGNGFHGRTLGALSATESPKYRKGFEPLLPSFDFAPLNDIEAFDRAINDNTSAVLVESIQGEGGIFVADDSFLQELSAICSQRKVMLLLDEVQAGIGRTGEFLGFQKSGILPSAVAMAKGLGGGFPIGAIWINEEYANTFGPGSHGTTFGGSPLACSAANAVLDVLEEENLISAARQKGLVLQKKLSEFITKYPDLISEVRGRGLMLALAFRNDPTPVVSKLREAGLLVVGAAGHSVRFLPPLNVLNKEIDQAIEIVDSTLSSLQPAEVRK